MTTSISALLTFTKAAAIPEYCSYLAMKFERLPFWNEAGRPAQYKVISIEHKNDVRICSIFNRNARQIIGYNSAWPLHTFGTGNDLYDMSSTLIPQGIVLWHYEGHVSCPVEVLHSAYTKTYQCMTAGWAEKDPCSIPFKFEGDLKDYFLFSKKASIADEDDLIRTLSDKFSLDGLIYCDDKWEDMKSVMGVEKVLYLWIKKSAFGEVFNKLGLQVTLRLETLGIKA